MAGDEGASTSEVLPTVGPFSVYFPFADGALGYRCEGCNALCCRGHGFGATSQELIQLGARYPRLPMFVRPHRDPVDPLLHLINFSSGCYFLKDDGRCGVELDHGRALKPYVCRTFPANQLQRAGMFLVVDVNFLCPMRPTRAGDTPLRHTDVLADLQQSIEVPMQLESGNEALLPAPLLRFEATLRDLPHDEDVLRRLALADVMAARWERPSTSVSEVMLAAHRAYLVRLRSEIIALLGLEGAVDPERPRFALELGVMLPRIRLLLLRLRKPDRLSIGELLPALGRRLVALTVYLELIAVLGAEMTLGVIDTASRQGQLFCELLSMVDRVPIFTPSTESTAYTLTLYRTQEDELKRFLGFVHEENSRRRLSLGEIFGELGIRDPAIRAQLCQSFTPEALAQFRFELR